MRCARLGGNGREGPGQDGGTAQHGGASSHTFSQDGEGCGPRSRDPRRIVPESAPERTHSDGP
ncbi:hypothetical protein STXM2123_635 [Streptomyces sp. F-3]|nr:hypothetical protein STXM2123_635 [Streptomyces sp. F-3]